MAQKNIVLPPGWSLLRQRPRNNDIMNHMQKSYFLRVSFWGIFFILLPGISLALSAPLNPSESIVEKTHDYIAVEFQWDKNAEPGVEWYHLVYQCKAGLCSQADAAWVSQPLGAGRISKPIVGGFDFSLPAQKVLYQWRVGACSAQDLGACTYTSPREFETPLQPSLPGGGNKGGGDGGGDCGSDFGNLNPIPGTKTLGELFNNIFNFLFGLAIFIVPVIVIYAAFLMLMEGGDPIKLQKGRMI